MPTQTPPRCSDPDSFQLPLCEPGKLILGLDLGNSCGYCFAIPNKKTWQIEPHFAGLLDLSCGPYDSGAIRFVRLLQFLEVIKPSSIFYEQVKFTPSEKITRFSAARVVARAATAAELLGAFKSVLVTWAEQRSISCLGMDIGSIKKFATGKGNAGKPDMVRAMNDSLGTDFDLETCEATGADDIADAYHVLRLGLSQYGKGLIAAD